MSRTSPVHVTLRVLPHVWSLRSQRSLRVIETSAPWFDGWKEETGPAKDPAITSPPHSWLLAVGWRRRGLLSLDDIPAIRA